MSVLDFLTQQPVVMSAFSLLDGLPLNDAASLGSAVGSMLGVPSNAAGNIPEEALQAHNSTTKVADYHTTASAGDTRLENLQVAVRSDGLGVIVCSMYTTKTLRADVIRAPTLVFKDARGDVLFSVVLPDGPKMDRDHINVRFEYKRTFKFAPDKFAAVAKLSGGFRG